MEATAALSCGAQTRVSSLPGGREEKSPLERKVYMDYNATTPLEPEVIQAMTEAMQEAWGNPSSPYPAGRKAKDIISAARESLAKMIGGKPQDIVFTSGGTESNNLVIHSMLQHFHKAHRLVEGATPHFVTCTVEHDSVRLPLEHLVEERVAAVTFVPVSKVNGQAEADDILAAVRPATCLVTVMLANNETGVIMPIPELGRRVAALNQQRAASGLPRVLLHTDAAQALGKRRVDVRDLGVDFLTIVGHKLYGPRIGALYVRGLGERTPLYPMLFGGGQERGFRPGTENTPMIAGLGKAAELVTENCEAYEAHMRAIRDYLETRLVVSGGQPRGSRLSVRPGGFLCQRAVRKGTRDPRGQAGHGVWLHWTKGAVLAGAHCPGTLETTKVMSEEGRIKWLDVSWSQKPPKTEFKPSGLSFQTRDTNTPERAEFGKKIHLNSQFPGTERLPNTCNFSIRGPQLQGRSVLAQCRTLLASVGAACHSDQGDRPSPVLLSCGIPAEVARNALRLSVGRSTTLADVDLVVQDLKQAVARLEDQA